MIRTLSQRLSLAAVAMLAACSMRGMSPPVAPSGAAGVAGDGDVPFRTANPIRQLCPQTGTPERMQCF
ncbi:MAG TPA: hypothetical protein VEW74_04040, partial [Candidatus Nitrosotalea sp.]|nr:hypothetical protein [Candidatus Nitrosotalea sp.]